jgi:DNA-binding CsgD family transcriptional regulator
MGDALPAAQTQGPQRVPRGQPFPWCHCGDQFLAERPGQCHTSTEIGREAQRRCPPARRNRRGTAWQRHDAIARLSQARDVFARLEAAPFLERCRADLTTCGLAVQEPNPDGLTPRERHVASLVKHGHTNKEVASELFLTAKTVEFHLRNIYAKLGVPGRQQLRRMREP